MDIEITSFLEDIFFKKLVNNTKLYKFIFKSYELFDDIFEKFIIENYKDLFEYFCSQNNHFTIYEIRKKKNIHCLYFEYIITNDINFLLENDRYLFIKINNHLQIIQDNLDKIITLDNITKIYIILQNMNLSKTKLYDYFKQHINYDDFQNIYKIMNFIEYPHINDFVYSFFKNIQQNDRYYYLKFITNKHITNIRDLIISNISSVISYFYDKRDEIDYVYKLKYLFSDEIILNYLKDGFLFDNIFLKKWLIQFISIDYIKDDFEYLLNMEIINKKIICSKSAIDTYFKSDKIDYTDEFINISESDTYNYTFEPYASKFVFLLNKKYKITTNFYGYMAFKYLNNSDIIQQINKKYKHIFIYDNTSWKINPNFKHFAKNLYLFDLSPNTVKTNDFNIHIWTHYMRALIVRTIKHNQFTHDDFISHIKNETISISNFSTDFINKHITELIEDDYIEKNDDFYTLIQ